MQRVSSPVEIYPVVHFKANGSFKKHCEVKMWNLLVKIERFDLSVLLLFTTCSAILNTRLLPALVSITQNVFFTRSLVAGNSILWSSHQWRMPLHPCTAISLWHWISCWCHFNKHWVNIRYPHKGFFLSRTRPANAGTRNPRWTLTRMLWYGAYEAVPGM